ncbi:hypothetical protein Q7P37_000865 [Cladosporium fusiforme]
MAPNKGVNRASEFEELVDSAPQDFDPEADIPDSDSDASGDDDREEREAGARDHYAPVGKSKLRKPKEVALGPQYRGSRVDRNAVDEDDEEDDPFARGFDDEDSEEDAAEDDQDGSDDEEAEEDGTDATDMSDEEEGDNAAGEETEQQDRAELRKIMASEQKAVAASISAATKQDAEKGRAVKKQRTTFDSLLNTRIKLQKSLIATNTLVAPSEGYDSQISDAQDALDAAEAAAYNLWSSLTTFRDELTTARTGEKRKRSSKISAKAPIEKLWAYTQEQEEQAVPQRNTVLQKWSVKARGATAQPQGSRLNNTAAQATIIDVLNEHLTAPDRLLKRAYTPRSCAPVQLAAQVREDTSIYDDADFYGQLLKELLDAKSAQGSTAAANLDLGNVASMRRAAKTKRAVDTKASKGRKLKYDVHEKLQNFMAPEDRSRWGERQTDELFGSLFGQRLGLGEGLDEDEGEGQEEASAKDEEEAGLMMFRS